MIGVIQPPGNGKKYLFLKNDFGLKIYCMLYLTEALMLGFISLSNCISQRNAVHIRTPSLSLENEI